MTKPASSRLAQATSGIFAGILLGMLIEVIWFWPDGDWPPPRQFILRFTDGVRLPVVGPVIGAAFLAALGAIARGVTLRGMVRALAIGVSIGAFVGVFGGMVLGAVLAGAKDHRLTEARFHVAEDVRIDKFSQVDGLLIGVISGALLGGVVGTIIELRSRRLHPPTESSGAESRAFFAAERPPKVAVGFSPSASPDHDETKLVAERPSNAGAICGASKS